METEDSLPFKYLSQNPGGERGLVNFFKILLKDWFMQT